MVQSVTVFGSNYKEVGLSFDASSNYLLAQQIAGFLNTRINENQVVTVPDTGGTLPLLPPGVDGAYVQTTTGLAILPTGYTTDLITKPGAAVVFGSGGDNQTILSDVNTNLTFVETGGSGAVVAGGGNNRIMITGDATPAGAAPNGNGPGSNAPSWLLYTGGGNDLISVLGDVNATIGAGGGQNTIVLGNGHDVVISAGSDTIVGGSGAETIDATGAQQDMVHGGNSDLFFVGGAGGATILGGTGSDTYMGAPSGPVGKQVIEGGSAGHNYLFAGDGLATLIGAGKGDQLYAYGSDAQWLKAGIGNETLSAAASSGNDTLTAGSGKDSLIGSATGADTFVGGSGAATVSTGFGDNVFTFIKGQAGGSELVTGIFDPTSIKIDLIGYGTGEADFALSTATVTHGSVSIDLTDGTKITFQDVTSLNKSNFT